MSLIMDDLGLFSMSQEQNFKNGKKPFFSKVSYISSFVVLK